MSVPTGWRSTTLGELGRYSNGRGFRKSEWRDSGRPIIRIQNLTGSGELFNYFQGEVDEKHVARPGDLLVSWAATLGAYFWSGPEGVVNQHIFKVDSIINHRFHKYLLDYKLADLMRRTHGSGMVHITRGRFDAEPVNVPTDLSEQVRIVEILEDHLSRLDVADAESARASGRLKALRAVIFDRSIKGPSVRLGDLAVERGYGTSTKCAVGAPGRPVARIPNIVLGRLDMANEKRAVDPTIDLRALALRRHDMLIVRTNGSRDLIGRAALVEKDANVAFASYLIRYRLDTTRILPEWAMSAFESPRVREALEAAAASSAGQHNLSLAKLDAIEIPCPDLASQSEILGQLAVLTAHSERLQRAIGMRADRGTSLRRAVLAAAFEGKLTGRQSDLNVVEEIVRA